MRNKRKLLYGFLLASLIFGGFGFFYWYLPGLAATINEKGSVIEGRVEVIIIDDFEKGNYQTQYYLMPDSAPGKSFLLKFSGETPALLSGQKARARGETIGNQIIISQKENFEIISQPLRESQALTAVKKVAVILVNFQNDQSQPYNQDHAREVTFTGEQSANAYYREVSFGKFKLEGKLRVDGDIFGWYTIPYDNDWCNRNMMVLAQAAEDAAAADGFVRTGYTNFIYAFPKIPNCRWWGLGGGSYSWINGKYALEIVVHELGHNFGANHSSIYICKGPNGEGVPLSDNCIRGEYGDVFDVMGSCESCHFNNFQKGVAGWYESSNTKDALSSGVYFIAPIEKATSSVQALRVPRTRDLNDNILDYFYLEYRRPFGFDNFSPDNPVVNGITVRIAPNYDINFGFAAKPLLLDMNGEPDARFYNPFNAPLALGQAFVDPFTNISIKTASVSNEGALAEIFIPAPACVRRNPSVSISPLAQSGAPGSVLTYNLSVQNKDNPYCGASTFDMSSSLPEGWSQSPSSWLFSLDPGISMNTSFEVVSAPTAGSGTYSFSETVINADFPEYSALASAQYSVVANQSPNAPSKPTVSSFGFNRNYRISLDKVIDPEGDKVRAVFDFGDGKQFISALRKSGSKFSILHKYSKSGTYYVKAKARDKNGNESEWSQAQEVIVK